MGDSASDDAADTFETPRADPSTGPSSGVQHDPLAAAVVEALKGLPEAERGDVVEHLRALAALSPGRRAAVLTVARE